jgi:hypothetical protein
MPSDGIRCRLFVTDLRYDGSDKANDRTVVAQPKLGIRIGSLVRLSEGFSERRRDVVPALDAAVAGHKHNREPHPKPHRIVDGLYRLL